MSSTSFSWQLQYEPNAPKARLRIVIDRKVTQQQQRRLTVAKEMLSLLAQVQGAVPSRVADFKQTVDAWVNSKTMRDRKIKDLLMRLVDLLHTQVPLRTCRTNSTPPMIARDSIGERDASEVEQSVPMLDSLARRRRVLNRFQRATLLLYPSSLSCLCPTSRWTIL